MNIGLFMRGCGRKYTGANPNKMELLKGRKTYQGINIWIGKGFFFINLCLPIVFYMKGVLNIIY